MHRPQQEPVTLSRDCDAIVIPAGDSGTIPAGTLVTVTQSLGGSFTVYAGGNLFRIAGHDADALGKEPLRAPELPENATDADVEELVWAQLATCFDPEIPINIVELGLVYECQLMPLGGDERRVDVKMTLTAPGCGMGDVIAEDARLKLLQVPTITQAVVDIVFDPPWSVEMMSDAARLESGLM